MRMIEERDLRRAAVARRALCLTFDDGPGPETTPALLDLLAERGVGATFFCLGRRALQAPAIMDRIRESGHEVGCHSHDHLHAWKTPPFRAVADVVRGFETLSPWTTRPLQFRPPYGKLTPLTRAASRRRGARMCWWTVDSGDTRTPLPKMEAVVESVRRAGGGVVLMHDFDRAGGDRAERRVFVIELTRRLLDLADVEGMSVVRQGDLLRSGSGSEVGAA